MRGCPQEHLLQAWAGILDQQQIANGEQNPASLAQLRSVAMELWTACTGAALIGSHNHWGDYHSRCMPLGRALPVLQQTLN